MSRGSVVQVLLDIHVVHVDNDNLQEVLVTNHYLSKDATKTG